MGWLVGVPLLTAFVYAAWQLYNYTYWLFSLGDDPAGGRLPHVSVVVPFRNEAHNLGRLLASLAAQDYPGDRYEVILVDDHSEDGGAAGATLPVNARVIRLADGGNPEGCVAFKKAALSLGINRATGRVIVSTDADCSWSPGALRRIGERMAAGADVVLGPVFIDPVTDFCSAFQALDLAGYQLFTAATVVVGTPALANGAHFAFRRSAFERVGGYAGIDHLPSGDDVLLLHKFVAAGCFSIVYSTAVDGMVTTRPVAGWGALWRQRLRWAGKAGAYASGTLRVAQALAFVTSAAILLGLVLGVVFPQVLAYAGLAWLVKGAVDYLLLRSVCKHYGYTRPLRWYILAQLIYPFYLVAIGSAALLGFKAAWKGR